MRGDVRSFMVEIDGVPMWATMHMDKAPLTLLHTTGILEEGEPRYRVWSGYSKEVGRVVTRKYTLEQPEVAASYRSRFWTIDRFNKLALGPDSVAKAVKTKDWRIRIFMALVAMSETNAYLAFNVKMRAKGFQAWTRVQWK